MKQLPAVHPRGSCSQAARQWTADDDAHDALNPSRSQHHHRMSANQKDRIRSIQKERYCPHFQVVVSRLAALLLLRGNMMMSSPTAERVEGTLRCALLWTGRMIEAWEVL